MAPRGLSDEVVIKIKDDLIIGRLTQDQIAEKYSTATKPISRGLISNIATGRQYQQIGQALIIPKALQKGSLSKSPEERELYLIGENRRLRDHLSRNKRQMELAARHTYTIDYYVNELREVIKPLKAGKVKTYKPKKKTDITESAVLMLSDLHADSVVTPEEVDFMEDYNFPVCVQRMNHLVKEVAKWCNRSLSNFHFEELVIFGLGDFTNGDIHKADNYFSDQFTADLAIGELIGCMITELSTHFPFIRYCNVVGNHGRTTPKIEFDKRSVAHNHDTLIARIAELYCRDLDNVEFWFPESLSAIVDVRGYKFHLTHGHGKRQGASPWTRAETASAKTRSLLKGGVDYFCAGHYHTPGEVQVSGGATLLANGAVLACDQYSYQSLQEAGNPSQLLFGVHHNNGATWRIPINLRDQDGENRYESLERFYA